MKKCLIIVDYQVDFVTGSLGFEKAKLLDEKICNKILEYRKNNDEIIFTLDTHGNDYYNTYEGIHLPVSHCIKGTDGHKLYGKTGKMAKKEDKHFYKTCFGSAELYEYLRHNEYKSIELCGVVTNICVISNAILAKTAQPEIDIFVDSSCTASNDDKLNNEALNVMRSLHIKII